MTYYLYKIEQTEIGGYETYDSAVVVAFSPEQAARIHPEYGGDGPLIPLANVESIHPAYRTWTNDPKNVTVTYLGEAYRDYDKPQVVCASFNAG